ncbi:MAG: hypothetical protein PHT48_03675 [Dechloromonas sp.]|nr:hypothetical protein [Dechloromonas sp.]
MPDNDNALPPALLDEVANDGLTPHERLLKLSRDDAARVEERQAAIAKNRQRALELLTQIEKNLG